MKIMKNLTIFLILTFCTLTAIAQTTTFTYQGKLTDNGTPQSIYEMQFKLFGSVGGSDQIGGTITNPSVSVNQGVFTVNLDFGAAAFPGADRYLEISVRRNSGESFVTLNPRQQIASSPYSIRTLSAAQADIALDANKLGGVPASDYVTTSSVGNSFIKNSTTQQTANFNISGNGTAGGTLSGNAVNSVTQYNIGGNRVLSVPGTTNLFAGISAGQANTTGIENSFLGYLAGASNTSGSQNSFTGNQAGRDNTSGNFNSFFGRSAGASNRTANDNSFFGFGTGANSTTGNFNSFFGSFAGNGNLSGNQNTFVGRSAGSSNSGGSSNVFIGMSAASFNTTGNFNTAVGSFASVGSNLFNATAIGADAVATQSNSLILGNGVNVGIGTSAPNTKLALRGGTAWTSNGWTGSLSMGNGGALGWEANASGQRFGIGQSSGGLYFFRTNSAFGSTASPANYDLQITDTGNITQARDKGGLVKAMIYVDPFLPASQYIVRCYNGMTNQSTGNCGFSVSRTAEGRYTINFGFAVNDRFLSLTQGFTIVTGAAGFSGTNTAYVSFYDAKFDADTDSRFYLIVY